MRSRWAQLFLLYPPSKSTYLHLHSWIIRAVLSLTGHEVGPHTELNVCLWVPTFEIKSKKWIGVRTGILPDSVAPEDAVLVALRRRLPLDHDGLVGPATSDDVLRRGTGGLLWKRDTAQHIQTHMRRYEERGRWGIENHHEHSFSLFQAKNIKLCNNVTGCSNEAYQFKTKGSFLAFIKNPDHSLCALLPNKMQCPPLIPPDRYISTLTKHHVCPWRRHIWEMEVRSVAVT